MQGVNCVGNVLPTKTRDNPNQGRVYDVHGLAPCITNISGGGGRQPFIVERVKVASRGRNPENPSDRTTGAPTKQRLEPNEEGLCNTLTSVQKDNLVLEVVDGEEIQARVRKLTPAECWRLMGFKDEDFRKAEAVNSNSQLYKEAGNSIVRQVLIGIFSQMHIQGIKTWNERSADERRF